jgi:hypothetical protein
MDKQGGPASPSTRPEYPDVVPRRGIDFGAVRRQLQIQTHVTLQLLWEELSRGPPDASQGRQYGEVSQENGIFLFGLISRLLWPRWHRPRRRDGRTSCGKCGSDPARNGGRGSTPVRGLCPISFGTERCEWLFRRDVNKPLLSYQPGARSESISCMAAGRRRRPAACPETQGGDLPGAAAVTNDSVCSTE